MILVDTREDKSCKDLIPYLSRLGLKVETTMLPFGDVAFNGRGPENSTITIGIERKKLRDMLNCIESARFNQQRIGMRQMYAKSALFLEGIWTVGTPPFQDGVLIEGFNSGGWKPLLLGQSRVMYSKMYRYLMSVELSGTVVTYSRDIIHTAFNVAEWYHYFQKRWEDHTSMLTPQKLAIPDMNGKSSLVRRWAIDIDEIGVKLSMEADKVFKSPRELANADEAEWLQVPGIHPKTAKRIVRQVMGMKD